MADVPLLERLRKALSDLPVAEQKMFGGTCFMLAGNMLVCTSKRGLLARVGKDGHAAALALPHAAAMEMGGRAMEGYVFVAAEGTSTDKDLKAWIRRARDFVETLPAKSKKSASKAPKKAVASAPKKAAAKKPKKAAAKKPKKAAPKAR
jgi:TfoX/Sxy family transcriptional regulator of competence genes